MSMFICDICQHEIDSDFHECYESPKDNTRLICEDCMEFIEDEKRLKNDEMVNEDIK